MKAFRTLGLIGTTLLLAVLLVACGDTAMQGMQSQNANQHMNNQDAMNNKSNSGMMYNTPTTTSTMGTNNNGNMNNNNSMNNTNSMMGGITIVPGMGGNMNAFIHTGVATINNNKVNVLMTNKGFAVYYYRADPMLKATCTGQCAQDWPPLLAPQGMMTISSTMTLPRQLTIHQTANGAQVFYDGHALYTYGADMQAGIATGRGQDMMWYLVGFTL
jgi:predicted lipoprotein with Yx(FWY)xxD motif